MYKDIIIYTNQHFSFECPCSYCNNRSNIYKSLIKLGYNVAILPFNCDWDYFYPTKLHFDYALQYQNRMFGQLMFEANKYPKKMIEFANTYFDYIICSSTFLKDNWIKSGIDKKYLIDSCLGVDTSIFNTAKPKVNLYPKKFKFLIVGNWQHRPEWQDRKGLDFAVKCFKEVFGGSKRVQLVIKTDSYAPDSLVSDNIALIKRKLTDSEMADLYKSCSLKGVFFSPHKGEGFGKSILEAMCCGCNIGATNFSGVKTFLNKSNATLFNYSLNDWGIYPNDFYSDGKLPQLALANEKEVKEWMLEVSRKKPHRQYINIQQYSWDYIVSALMEKIKYL